MVYVETVGVMGEETLGTVDSAVVPVEATVGRLEQVGLVEVEVAHLEVVVSAAGTAKAGVVG